MQNDWDGCVKGRGVHGQAISSGGGGGGQRSKESLTKLLKTHKNLQV